MDIEVAVQSQQIQCLFTFFWHKALTRQIDFLITSITYLLSSIDIYRRGSSYICNYENGKKNIGTAFDCFIIYDLDIIKYIITTRIEPKLKNLDHPLPLQVYNTIQIHVMFTQQVGSTDHMTVTYKLSMVHKHQLNLFVSLI